MDPDYCTYYTCYTYYIDSSKCADNIRTCCCLETLISFLSTCESSCSSFALSVACSFLTSSSQVHHDVMFSTCREDVQRTICSVCFNKKKRKRKSPPPLPSTKYGHTFIPPPPLPQLSVSFSSSPAAQVPLCKGRLTSSSLISELIEPITDTSAYWSPTWRHIHPSDARVCRGGRGGGTRTKCTFTLVVKKEKKKRIKYPPVVFIL